MPSQQLDPDGVWRQAIPFPFYVRQGGLFGTGLFGRWGYKCMDCGHVFDFEQAYRDHYRSDHPDA